MPTSYIFVYVCACEGRELVYDRERMGEREGLRGREKCIVNIKCVGVLQKRKWECGFEI